MERLRHRWLCYFGMAEYRKTSRYEKRCSHCGMSRSIYINRAKWPGGVPWLR